MALDMDKLQQFLGRFVTDLEATFALGTLKAEPRITSSTRCARRLAPGRRPERLRGPLQL